MYNLTYYVMEEVFGQLKKYCSVLHWPIFSIHFYLYSSSMVLYNVMASLCTDYLPLVSD